MRSATLRRTPLDKLRYRPQQWHTRGMWRPVSADSGESWRGFSCVRQLPGLPPELLMVPLVGHTLGHAGVVVERSAGTLFYAADAYFYHAEMDVERPHCTPGLALYQTMMEKDRGQRLYNQERLRALRKSNADDLTLFCAHDVQEFEQLSGRALGASVRQTDATSCAL
ncbi:MAG: fold metallo-hydrolase [Myxococcaceae bacterium]|nr:fold metallo-hydrolase [Myxococcaceae bacterium]